MRKTRLTILLPRLRRHFMCQNVLFKPFYIFHKKCIKPEVKNFLLGILAKIHTLIPALIPAWMLVWTPAMSVTSNESLAWYGEPKVLPWWAPWDCSAVVPWCLSAGCAKTSILVLKCARSIVPVSRMSLNTFEIAFLSKDYFLLFYRLICAVEQLCNLTLSRLIQAHFDLTTWGFCMWRLLWFWRIALTHGLYIAYTWLIYGDLNDDHEILRSRMPLTPRRKK